jgi:hypothetical protein
MLMNLRTAGETLLSNPTTQPKTLTSAIAGKGDFYGFSGLLIMSMMLGYAKEMTKEVAAGRDSILDPTDPNVALRSFLNGGAAGLYGDFLFRELHRNYGTTALELAAGPVISEAGEVLDLGRKAMQGEATWEDVFKKAWDNTPGHNVFYAKGALDYLVSNNIREYLNHGFKYRLERRLNSQPGLIDRNQHYWAFQPTR